MEGFDCAVARTYLVGSECSVRGIARRYLGGHNSTGEEFALV